MSAINPWEQVCVKCGQKPSPNLRVWSDQSKCPSCGTVWVLHRCPVKGHDHVVRFVRSITQQGTGAQARVWECPTGRYRWFVLDGRELSDVTRTARPRFGWYGEAT